MPNWIGVGAAELQEGELRGLEMGERLVLLTRLAGRVTAMDDSCNHAGCLLSGGWIEAGRSAVVRPCHEYALEPGPGRNGPLPPPCGDPGPVRAPAQKGRAMSPPPG